MRKKAEERIGEVYGRLAIVGVAGRDKFNNVIFECECSCGRNAQIEYGNLLSGNTRSCGCLIRGKKADDVLPADICQKLHQDFEIWQADVVPDRSKKFRMQRTLLSKALYRIGKLAAIPLSLIPGTEQFNQHWFDMSCEKYRKRYSSAVEKARSACTTALAQCESNERMRLMGELRLLPQSHRTLIGV